MKLKETIPLEITFDEISINNKIKKTINKLSMKVFFGCLLNTGFDHRRFFANSINITLVIRQVTDARVYNSLYIKILTVSKRTANVLTFGNS
jgi:hypothetical protein